VPRTRRRGGAGTVRRARLRHAKVSSSPDNALGALARARLDRSVG
jgi:hypothetical protein